MLDTEAENQRQELQNLYYIEQKITAREYVKRVFQLVENASLNPVEG